MKNPPERRSSDARFDLPSNMAQEIGAIIVAWGFIEHLLQKAIWRLVGVDEPAGRLAIREPRVTDRVNLICDLAKLRDLTLPDEAIKDLRKQLDTSSTVRDLLAHGAWTFTDVEGWMVIRTRGSYPHPVLHSRNRKVDPEALKATAASLTQLRAGIEATVESVRNLCKFIWEAYPQSGGKSR